jgi:hypothetical protein
MTKAIWLKCLNADSQAAAIEVIKRMGWDIDTEHLRNDGVYLVTFPDKDENLFEFLDMCWS